MMIIPSTDRKEWKELLTGKLDVSLNNFFFQMKVTQAKNQIQKGTVSLETAINDLHALCKKFSKANNMTEDLERIFGKEYLKNESSKNTNETIILSFDNKKEQDTQDNKTSNLYDSLKIERELLFYKKTLEEKERTLQDKNKKIIKLQDELTLVRKKNKLLYDSLKKIEEIQQENIVEEDNIEDANSNEKNGWSFFNIFKK